MDDQYEEFLLDAISPIDGRYRRTTDPLADFFSENALMKYRVEVEAVYLLVLSEHPGIGVREFSSDERSLVAELHDSFDTMDAQFIKAIETKKHGVTTINDGKPTYHDVKAVEYFMKHKLAGTSLEDSLEWIHFGLTSEDVNNLAYGMMLSDGFAHVLEPEVREIARVLRLNAENYAHVPLLARTHGQSASPTTFGKEFAVFSSRVDRQLAQIGREGIQVKLNGATGNYNAHHAAYPDVDWVQFSKDFIDRLSYGREILLVPNLVTTQIEPHDTYAELFAPVMRLNNVLVDLSQDLWRYISDDWIVQEKEGVGSSTMPHKVNPINFENAEGNLLLANTLFEFFSRKLPISRLQRDLSDSTVERNFGVAAGHSLIGYRSLLKGLGKIKVNETKVAQVLEDNPKVVAEGIQTILRREGFSGAYEAVKAFTQGEKITLDGLYDFVRGLHLDSAVEKELLDLTPANYTGLAAALVEELE
tara:strand:+ start:1125 stop:2549 length:1425 start_codon:yes stop_codon:yes gene_type:complete